MAQSILLSFDAEEFDIPGEFGHAIPASEQLRIGAEGWGRVLDLLDDLNRTPTAAQPCAAPIRATFFTTAAIAEFAPELARRTLTAGHELASHGVRHTGFAPGDEARSKQLLEAAAPGASITGFRMPRMAPVDIGALARAGYRYNASENPIWLPGRYNKFFVSRRWSVATTTGGSLIRVPAAATPLIRWPLFWLSFKNAPLWWTKRMTAWCLRADGYAALYFHPWEFCDLAGPGGFGLPRHVRRLDGAALTARLRQYLEWLRARGATFETYARFAGRVAPQDAGA
ncbi:polysaccharide deacetylase family protein [soil metagenome]